MSRYGIRKSCRVTNRSVDDKWYGTLGEAIYIARTFDNPVGFTVFLRPELTRVIRRELFLHDCKDFWRHNPAGDISPQFAAHPELFEIIVNHVQGVAPIPVEDYQDFLATLKQAFPNACWVEDIVEPIDSKDILEHPVPFHTAYCFKEFVDTHFKGTPHGNYLYSLIEEA